MRNYRAVLSSDWNECLAPCGPFDFIFFTYPDLRDDLTKIFRRYTTNALSLGEAVRLMQRMMPRPIRMDEMDAYLAASFQTYPGLSDWIEWCLSHDILFMINTTGMQGYFQRILGRGQLPSIPALSAHPMLRYGGLRSDPDVILDLLEIQDKPKNTEAAMRLFGITSGKIIVMGDSGGDGPHFEWGARAGALLIGSMTKPSLEAYCDSRGIAVDVRFGGEGPILRQSEGAVCVSGDFMALTPFVEEYLNR
jgi:hypothetical protein